MFQEPVQPEWGSSPSYQYYIPLVHGSVELVRGILRHKVRVLVALAFGLSLGGAYIYLANPEYRSTAQLLVTQKRPRSLPIPGVDPRQSYFDDSLSTHQVLLKSPLMIRKAIQTEDILSLGSFSEMEESALIQNISSGLTIARDAKSMLDQNNAIFNMSYEHAEPEECRLVLEAVIRAYAEYLRDVHRRDREDIRELFLFWRDDVQTQLGKKKEEYARLRDSIEPQHWRSKDGVNLAEGRVAEIFKQRLDLLVELAQATERLDTLNAAKESGQSNQVLFQLITGWTTTRDGQANVQDDLFGLLLEEQRLLEKYGPKHRELEGLRKRIKIAARLVLGTSSDEGDIALMDPIEVYKQSLSKDIEVKQTTNTSLQAIIDSEHQNAKLAHEINEDLDQLQAEVDSIMQLYNEIVKRLQEVDVIGGADVVEAITLAAPKTGVKVLTSQPRAILLGATFLGACLAGMSILLADMKNGSFRSPNEIVRRLQVSILAHIPYSSLSRKIRRNARRDNATIDPVIITASAPNTVAAEAYRKLRTSLIFSANDAALKVVQVTSPTANDGKSTLAANLAVSIAQTGRNVILVEADLRTPTLIQIFGLASPNRGIVSILRDGTEPPDAIMESGVDGLKLLPGGPLPPNPSELLTSPRLPQLISSLRDQFDFVLFDTPPLLAVADPAIVAAQVDGVLVTVRNSRHAQSQAKHAINVLSSVEANVLGVVIKGTRRQSRRDGFGYEWSGNSMDYSDMHFIEVSRSHGDATSSALALPPNSNGSHTRNEAQA